MKHILILSAFSLVLINFSCKKEEAEPTTNEPSSVYIYSVVATPTNSESVTIKNNSGATADLTGWTVGDSNNPNVYTIPNGTSLSQGASTTFNASAMGFQINDSGETIYLKNSSGSTIDTWSN